MSKAINQLDKIIKRLKKTVEDGAVKTEALKSLGDFARDIVVKRTRLGYGVNVNLGQKARLAKLSPNYVDRRKVFSGISSLTSAKKSNLTRTGQMLASMQAKVSRGRIFISPTGNRNDGKTNLEVAEYNAKAFGSRPSRVFNRVSLLEFKQIVRFYRKTFGDLFKG
jgi:hypothetical protein